MARLPKPGGDVGSWGAILNDYLRVSHNDDGTLKSGIVSESKLSTNVRNKLNSTGSSQVADGSITTAKLANAAVTSAKLADAAVTSSKLAAGSVTDGSVAASGISQGKIIGLSSALDGKAAASHSHSLDDLTDVNVAGASNGQTLMLQNGQWGAATPASGASAVSSVAGKTGAVTLTKTDVGLNNVDNTSDSSKPVSTATQAALDAKANDSSVVHLAGNETVSGVKTFSASPLVPNPTVNSQASSKQYVDSTVASAVSGSSPTLANIPAGSTITVYRGASAWPSRPTARTDVTVQWIGGNEATPPSGGIVDKDIWIRDAS